jgi:hypothetical protein
MSRCHKEKTLRPENGCTKSTITRRNSFASLSRRMPESSRWGEDLRFGSRALSGQRGLLAFEGLDPFLQLGLVLVIELTDRGEFPGGPGDR